eukprot:SAG11_NODE_1103_length_5862_cov_8.036439_5_plen_123_part_00
MLASPYGMSNRCRIDSQERLQSVYVSEGYNAAAVFLTLEGTDMPYLCKFAVTEQAIGVRFCNAYAPHLSFLRQTEITTSPRAGNGLAERLWTQVKNDHPDGFFWRSHSNCEEVSGPEHVDGE